ncbi:MAG: preprotein translocase subunit SecG [candidate division Zixibacteria bacterium]|nr:preprotein translocase subunit SecG [candidate division Zixibacteria bacterium]
MITLLTMLHVIICICLIIVVLMQSAKGEGLAGAFGGSGITGAVFGGRGAATFLSKATTGLAIAFFLSCMVLSFLAPVTGRGGRKSSVIPEEAQKQATQGTVPATSVPTPAPEAQPQTPPQGETQQPSPGEGK